MIPEPSFISREWPVDESELRVKLTLRPGINIYTSVERISKEGAWVHVPGSAQSHGLDLVGAEIRVGRLLNGGWRSFREPAKTGPSLEDLHRLWTAVENWSREWPLSSGDELARLVRPLVGKGHPDWLDEGQASPL
jgi:hypothetical protein